jgi:hypothetical protein
MDQQRPRDHLYQFDLSPSAQAERLRKEARGTPPGVKRDQLLRRAMQFEKQAQMKALLNTPERALHD